MTGLVRAVATICAAVALLPVAAAQEDHSGLTRARFIQNCMMCHSRAAPEGVSPQILAGLTPEAGLRPAVAMPGITCWRRCDRCFPPDRPRGK